MLEEVRADLADRGIALGLAELHADVRGLLDRAGLIAAIGPDMIFDDLDDALRAFERPAPTKEEAMSKKDKKDKQNKKEKDGRPSVARPRRRRRGTRPTRRSSPGCRSRSRTCRPG